jgi:N-acetylglucosaminyl-diphospho-decaprenol L-rhamnosyltransferase
LSDLSVVIVTWNGWEFLSECLDSLDRAVRRAGTLDLQVIVVDNGSEDGTRAGLAARFAWAECVALAENAGFAAGANAGLRRASGRHAVLLNNDTQVGPGALEACVAYLDAHPEVGVVGPQLLGPDGRRQNSVHDEPSLIGEIVPHWLLQTLWPRRHPSKRQAYRAPVAVDAVLGACLVVRAEVLARVGLLPEEYFFFLEETDWCRAIRAAGWRVVHLPDVNVTHVLGATSKKRDPARTRIEYHRSLYRFFRKNRGPAALGVLLAVRLAKSVLHVVVGAPAALFSRKGRERWWARWRVLVWHVSGLPEGWGLAPASRRA